MHKIRDWLYIGRFADTRDGDTLYQTGITAMLQLAGDSPQPNITSLYLPVDDGVPVSHENLQQGIEFIRQQKAEGKQVLSACGAGVSRSTLFAMGAMMEEESIDLFEAYREVSFHHPNAMPNPQLVKSLMEYHGQTMDILDIYHRLEAIQESTEQLLKRSMIKGDGFYLRLLETGDIATVARLMNDSTLTQSMRRLPLPFTPEHALNYVHRYREWAFEGKALPLVIVPNQSSVVEGEDTFIGMVILELQGDGQSGELAFWIGKSYRGQRYATQAVSCLVTFAFEKMDLQRLYAFSFEANRRSQAVMKRCGFAIEQVWSEDADENGHEEAVVRLGLWREDAVHIK